MATVPLWAAVYKGRTASSLSTGPMWIGGLPPELLLSEVMWPAAIGRYTSQQRRILWLHWTAFVGVYL
jgi:hypothetical protein